jgi:glycosyltransferase involved in cell wall biosynthesis
MRIGIDVRYLSHGLMGGVHAYVAQFVPALIDLASDHQIFLYADTKRPFELRDLPEHVTVRYLSWKSPLSSVYNDLFMSRQVGRDHLDVLHFPANYGFAPTGVRTVITLHDEINILPLYEILRGHAKTRRTMAMMTYLHFCTRLAVARADLLLTVSDYSRRAIAKWSGFDSRRILLSPSGPASDMRRVEDPAILADVRQRYALARPFALADAFKNPAALVRAWRRLPPEVRNSHQIIFFARRPEVQPIVHEAVSEGIARLLIGIPRADLTALYSMAVAFVFPSWFEGFGLPPIEAMLCGAPVIASDRGSIPEITAGAALLADAEDDTTIARHIESVIARPEVAAQLRERGFARAADFSWPKTAQRILESYYVATNASSPVLRTV